MTTPAAGFSSPLVPLALEIHDALTVCAAGGWESVRLELDPKSLLRPKVGRLVTTLGAAGSQPKPELGVTAGAFYGVLNEVIPELIEKAQEIGLRARPVALQMKRQPGSARLTLLGANDEALRAIDLDASDLGLLVFSEPMLALLKRSDEELAPKQDAFLQDALGYDAWRYEQPSATLHLVKGELPWRRYKAHALGTWSQQTDGFVWAWADPSLDETCKAAVKTVRAEVAKEPGFTALARPSVPCDQPFAWTLARLAAMKLGARGIFRGENERGALFLAIAD